MGCPETWRERWERWRGDLDDDGGRYYFDEEQADRAVRFVETYCHNFKGEWAGEPIVLHDFQRDILRDLFGWRVKSTNRKRFKEAYVELPKNGMKTTLCAAMAMHGLIGEGVKAAEVYTVAGTTKQSSIAFDGCKDMLDYSPKLGRALRKRQFSIHHYKSKSKIEVLSGSAEGKQEFHPSLIIGDEVHEWPNRRMYEALTSAAIKRELLCCWITNSGHDRNSVCYELRQRAEAVLSGNGEDRYYPVLFGPVSPDPKHWTNEDLWIRSHPGIGTVVQLDELRDEWAKAKRVPALLPRNARLYLGVWTQSAESWMDMGAYDAVTGELPGDDGLAGLPCYVGLDMSRSNDATAVASCWVDEDAGTVYVRVKQWMTRLAAEGYEERDSTPYRRWAADRPEALELTPEPVISEARIIEHVLDVAANNDVKLLAFDRWRANRVTSAVEVELGVEATVPVAQSFSGIGPAVSELDHRIKGKAIVFERNPLLRWQWGNVAMKVDDAGNARPVKAGSRGSYEGTRSRKIDGPMAVLFALSRDRPGGKSSRHRPSFRWRGPRRRSTPA